MTFIVDLRPNLATGSYNVTRAIEIDPIFEGVRQWINYGQEDIGKVGVEEGNDNPSINLDKTGETFPERTGFLTGSAIQEVKDFFGSKDILTLVGMLTFLISLLIISITFYKVKKLRYSR